MFLLVFSGPERSTSNLLAALDAEGFPAQPARDRSGFPLEPLTEFVEVLGHPDLVDHATAIARAHGFTLRLHSPVDPATTVGGI